MKKWNIVYYISTVLLSVSMLMFGFLDLTQAPRTLAVMEHLGYPAYFASILGVAKILGVVGIWQNKVQFIREWAYAGFFFDLIGAFVSHLAVGDGPQMYMPSLITLLILTTSYISFRKRGLGVKNLSPVQA